VRDFSEDIYFITNGKYKELLYKYIEKSGSSEEYVMKKFVYNGLFVSDLMQDPLHLLYAYLANLSKESQLNVAMGFEVGDYPFVKSIDHKIQQFQENYFGVDNTCPGTIDHTYQETMEFVLGQEPITVPLVPFPINLGENYLAQFTQTKNSEENIKNKICSASWDHFASFQEFMRNKYPTETLTETLTETPAKSLTKTLTGTSTNTEISTETPTETPTETSIETPTETLTQTSTETPTETPTEISTKTLTEIFTKTPAETQNFDQQLILENEFYSGAEKITLNYKIIFFCIGIRVVLTILC